MVNSVKYLVEYADGMKINAISMLQALAISTSGGANVTPVTERMVTLYFHTVDEMIGLLTCSHTRHFKVIDRDLQDLSDGDGSDGYLDHVAMENATASEVVDFLMDNVEYLGNLRYVFDMQSKKGVYYCEGQLLPKSVILICEED